MRKIFSNLLYRTPSIYLLFHFFRPRLKGVRGDLQSVHDEYAFADNESTISVDLGCGLSPSNLFKSAVCKGVDLFEVIVAPTQSLSVYSNSYFFPEIIRIRY